MNPETFYKIVFLTFAREIGVSAFSLVNFFANDGKQVLINSDTQYGAYIAAQAVDNSVTPAILLPIFANSKLAADFIQVSNSMPTQPERVATVAVLFAAGAAITKAGDIPTNASMGALIAAFAQYMESTTHSGNVPFLYRRARRLNLTVKQHIQMELLIAGLILAGVGCFVIIVYSTKRLVKLYKRFLIKCYREGKKIKFKRLKRFKYLNNR